MAINVNDGGKMVCPCCGMMYARRQGNFLVSYARSYKGLGYIPICKVCIDKMYNEYVEMCNDTKKAVRQMCRKLDLFWSESLYEATEKKVAQRSLIAQYIGKTNLNAHVGKSYDDTLINENALWVFPNRDFASVTTFYESIKEPKEADSEEEEQFAITDEIKSYWGPGYTPEMYEALEQRRAYWDANLPPDVERDVGTEALIRQICSTELDINRGRAAGENVNQSIATLNTLLGSARLKPSQKKTSDDTTLENTPLGVWLYRYENERPLPEIDDDLKDVNGIRKYVFTWMGHLCKMLGLKNAYSELYEDEIAKYRVVRPEYDGDDEELFMDVMLDEDGDSP